MMSVMFYLSFFLVILKLRIKKLLKKSSKMTEEIMHTHKIIEFNVDHQE